MGIEILLLFSQMFAGVILVNVALNKRATFCDEFPLEKSLDGIKKLDEFDTLTRHCFKALLLKIDLISSYIIHYVTFLEGRGSGIGRLSFFRVFSVLHPGSLRCSEYPGKAKPISEMRVNCMPTHSMFPAVQILSSNFGGLNIVEIEVHSLTPGIESYVQIFRGCFKNFGGSTKPMQFITCLKRCVSEDQIYVGIKKRTICACSNIIDEAEEVSMESCSKCAILSEYCGGEDTFAVYLIKIPFPYFIGCHEVSPSDGYSVTISGSMTILKCINRCENESYALLQDGDNCICSNTLTSTKNRPFSNQICTSVCTADNTMLCGGKQHISAFATCRQGRANFTTCSRFFRCAGQYNMYGDCGGTCELGFTGENCLERNYFPTTSTVTTTTVTTTTTTTVATTTTVTTTTTTNATTTNVEHVEISQDKRFIENGSQLSENVRTCDRENPCVNLSFSYCVDGGGKPSCECVSGYMKNNVNKCGDLNECAYAPCDHATCKNNNGSYACECEVGFIRAADDICIKDGTLRLSKDNSTTTDFVSTLLNLVALTLVIPLIASLIVALYHWHPILQKHPKDVTTKTENDPIKEVIVPGDATKGN